MTPANAGFSANPTPRLDGPLRSNHRNSYIDYSETPRLGTGSGAACMESSRSSSDESVMASFIIALVGPKSAGKSFLVTHNLRQPQDASEVLLESEEGFKASCYSCQFNVLGIQRKIQLVVVDQELLTNPSNPLNTLSWPEGLPNPDGVMLCYKHADTASALSKLHSLLQAFERVPMIVLATQCEGSVEESAAISTKAVETANIHGAGLVHLDGGKDDPNRKAKNSLQWVLRKVIEVRNIKSAKLAKKKSRLDSLHSSTDLSESTRTSKEGQSRGIEEEVEDMDDDEEGAESFKDTQSESNLLAEESKESLLSSINTDNINLLQHTRYSQTDIYLSKEDLVQKFLFAAVSGNDEAFVEIFLINYRRVLRPHDVLLELYERYTSLDVHADTDPLLTRFAQTKLINILLIWLEQHPSDFTGLPSMNLLRTFIERATNLEWLHHYVEELVVLENIAQATIDRESVWALSDLLNADTTSDPLASQFRKQMDLSSIPPERRPSLVPSFSSTLTASTNFTTPSLDMSSRQSSSPMTPTLSNSSHQQSPVDTPAGLNSASSASRKPERAPSDSFSSSASTSSSLLNKQPSSRQLLLLEASNLVLDTPISHLAQQITRTAWDILAQIQPRHLLRYVLVPKNPDSMLSSSFPRPPSTANSGSHNPVEQSIAFVNYLSDWIATLILVQSKPKMRVKLYQHFLKLAIQLRSFDNFDCLMAVLLGLNCQPVHRLEDLNASLGPEESKKFKSLNIMMSTSRAFSAYRIAITNARPEKIPYLGIHLQDITRLNDGKPDTRDGLVNWTKMKQIGKHCHIVAESSRLNPNYRHSDQLNKLVSELPVYSVNEGMLYDLSFAYKPRQSTPKSTFPGLQANKAKFVKLFQEAMAPRPTDISDL